MEKKRKKDERDKMNFIFEGEGGRGKTKFDSDRFKVGENPGKSILKIKTAGHNLRLMFQRIFRLRSPLTFNAA